MDRQRIKNVGKGNLIEKIKRKIRHTWISKLRKTRLYKYCYKSYWHLILFHGCTGQTDSLYFSARPNPGAGIGHQIANWIAGYWFAKQFGLGFAHIPFPDKWEGFLGFYQGEKTFNDLKRDGYKIVRVQLFDEYNTEEYGRIRKIISSYAGKKVIFLAEQDQFYHDQYGVIKEIQDKFYSAPERKQDKLLFDRKNCFNIAVHVRRGDILEGIDKASDNISMRFQHNEYFVQALETALNYLKGKKNVHIYLFSQGEEKDFPEFSEIPNLHFCLDMGAKESFLHMIYADALITSKSSFSYKPALLNRGIKFCPADFWHGYPDEKDWILLNETGYLA